MTTKCASPSYHIDTPNLKVFSPLLFESRDEIVSQWIDKESTLQILQQHDIDPAYFQATYGIPVVEYFAGVVEGTKKLGDCPVMQKFVSFLSEKGITAQEIFNLCMALRKSLIRYLFDLNVIRIEKAAEVLDEVGLVFDSNLSGVLQTFTEMTREKDKKLQEQMLINRQQKKLQTILNLQNSVVCLVKQNQITLANRKFFELTGVKNLSMLHAYYPDNWGFITDVDYQSTLFEKKNYTQWLEEIVEDTDHLPIKVIIVNRKTKKNTILILKVSRIPDQQKQYILSMTDVTAYERKMEEITSHAYKDMQTGVFNKLKFDIALKALIQEQEGQLLLIDIDRFEQLQNDYDKALIDELLNKVGHILRMDGEKNFSAYRIDSGTFVLIPQAEAIENMEAILSGIIAKIKNLHSYISEAITCSVGTLTIRQDDHYEQVYERFNQLQEALKFSENGSHIEDKELFQKQLQLIKENEQIRTTIQEVAAERKMFEAVAVYKEIPVAWKLKLLRMDGKSALFSIVNETSLLFKAEKVYLKLPGYRETVEAKLSALELDQKHIVLSQFHLIASSFMDRKSVRVKPEKDFIVILESENRTATGVVQDISHDGLSLRLESIEGFHIGESAKIDIIMAENDKSQNISTEVNIHMFKKVDQDYIVTMALLLDQENEKRIKSYVSWRQMQIIKELKNLIGTMR